MHVRKAVVQSYSFKCSPPFPSLFPFLSQLFFLHLSLLPSSSFPLSFFILSSLPLPLIVIFSSFLSSLSPSFLLSLFFPHSSPPPTLSHADTSVPTELISLHDQGAKYIACGDDHTAILTAVNSQTVRLLVCSLVV